MAVGVEPPDPSERVNGYLPKSLIARADKRAAELGMSRSSFFGLAVSSMLGYVRDPRLAALSPVIYLAMTSGPAQKEKQPRQKKSEAPAKSKR